MKSRNRNFLVWVLALEIPVILLSFWQMMDGKQGICVMDAVRLLCDPKVFFRVTIVLFYGMVLMLKEDFNALKVMQYGERYQLWLSQFIFVVEYAFISSAWMTLLSVVSGRMFTKTGLNWMYDSSYYSSRTQPPGLTSDARVGTILLWSYLCVSLLMIISGMMIVLGAWLFDSFVAGFLVVVGVLAVDAFSTANIFYRRFSIKIDDWGNFLHTVPLKMLYLSLILAVFFLAGLLVCNRKEFYPRERNATGDI